MIRTMNKYESSTFSNISVVISCIYERSSSTQRKHNHLQECMTYHWIINMRDTVGVTRETGTTYPSGAPEFTSDT
jgi:hypothetical protein